MLNLHVVVPRTARMRECHDNGGMLQGAVSWLYGPPLPPFSWQEESEGEGQKN